MARRATTIRGFPMAKWNYCAKKQPEESTTVMVAEPYLDETRVAQFVLVGDEKVQTWFLANTNEQIWPTMWKPLPPHPMISN